MNGRNNLVIVLVGLICVTCFASDALARGRYLNPTLGRYMSRDPVADPAFVAAYTSQRTRFFLSRSGYHDGMSLYQYVRTRPTGSLDPFGLWEVDCQACGGCKGKNDVKGEVDTEVTNRIKNGLTAEKFALELGKGMPHTEIEKIIMRSAQYASRDNNLPSKYKGTVLDFGLQGCVKLCGECVGADKLGHMMAQGWEYYRISVLDGKGDALAKKYGEFLEGKGKSDDYTPEEQKYFREISSGLIDGKNGFGYGGFGRNASGVISNADLAANYSGLSFYKDLANGKFRTICDYVNKDWDEEQNFNEYTDRLGDVVKKNGRR